MDDHDRRRIQTFLDKWQGSQGNERANYQVFFDDLCGALAVDRPPPKGNVVRDPYCFDKEIKVFNKISKDSNIFVGFYNTTSDSFFMRVQALQSSDSSKYLFNWLLVFKLT